MLSGSDYSNAIKLEAIEFKGFPCLYISGLNIFQANQVEIDETNNPALIFMKNLVAKHVCAAQIGLRPLEYLPATLINPLDYPEAKDWQLTPIEIYYTTFEINSDNVWRGAFTTEINDLMRMRVEDNSIYELLLDYDAFALFVDCEPDAPQFIARLMNTAYVDDPKWVRDCLHECNLMVVPLDSNKTIFVMAKDKALMNIVDDPLKMAQKLITQSSWFKSNENKLSWNEDACCLTLVTNS